MDIRKNKRKKWTNEDQLNNLKKFKPWLEDKEDRRWQTAIPGDILSIISDLLPLSDFINFRGVCRNWRGARSCRSNITELSKKDLWCILYDFDARDKDMCLFYQCSNRRSCSVRLPGLRGAKCFASKHGWFFLRRNNDYLFFNPLTLEEIFLPKRPRKSFGSSACQVGTFSGSPSSRHCVVVLLSLKNSSSVRIASCRVTAKKWTVTAVKFCTRGVRFESVLRTNPIYVYFEEANDVSRRFNLINNISIVYGSHCLHFDFNERKHVVQIVPLIGRVMYDMNSKIWYSKLMEVHSDDWLCKFGKESTLSFCLFNDCKGVEQQVFGPYPATIANGPVIKAALLDKN